MKCNWTYLLFVGAIISGCKREAEPPRRVYMATPPSKAQYGKPADEAQAPKTLHGNPGDAIAPSGSPHGGPTGMSAGAMAAPPTESLGITWNAPSTWQPMPLSNPMRKASYKVVRTGTDIDDAELAVFYFGTGQGGSIDANVERWLRQFSGISPQSVLRETRTIHGLKQHIVKVDHATFNSGMPGGPSESKSNWALLGAIVESPSGPFFFKLTGPSATLKANEKSFYGLMDSVKTKV